MQTLTAEFTILITIQVEVHGKDLNHYHQGKLNKELLVMKLLRHATEACMSGNVVYQLVAVLFYYNGSVIFNRLNFLMFKDFIHVYCNCM